MWGMLQQSHLQIQVTRFPGNCQRVLGWMLLEREAGISLPSWILAELRNMAAIPACHQGGGERVLGGVDSLMLEIRWLPEYEKWA